MSVYYMQGTEPVTRYMSEQDRLRPALRETTDVWKNHSKEGLLKGSWMTDVLGTEEETLRFSKGIKQVLSQPGGHSGFR